MKSASAKYTKSIAAGVLLASALTPAVTMAFEAGDIVVRAGVSQVDPDASSDQLALNGSEQAFINAVGPPKST